MGKIVEEILRVPVVVIGRIAGQYAKPRSDNFEMVNGGYTLAPLEKKGSNDFLQKKFQFSEERSSILLTLPRETLTLTDYSKPTSDPLRPCK